PNPPSAGHQGGIFEARDARADAVVRKLGGHRAATVSPPRREVIVACRQTHDTRMRQTTSCPALCCLVPGIHVFHAASKDVDGRDKPGHDETDVTSKDRWH